MATVVGQNFGASKPPKTSHHSHSGSQNASFLDSEDCMWHENPSEKIITIVGNGTFGAVLKYNR